MAQALTGAMQLSVGKVLSDDVTGPVTSFLLSDVGASAGAVGRVLFLSDLGLLGDTKITNER
jgi:hypothetical protein